MKKVGGNSGAGINGIVLPLMGRLRRPKTLVPAKVEKGLLPPPPLPLPLPMLLRPTRFLTTLSVFTSSMCKHLRKFVMTAS